MRITSRPLVVGVTTLAAAAVAAPAFATTAPTRPTSVTARAVHPAVAPKHRDALVVTLHTGRAAVRGEDTATTGATHWAVRNRHDKPGATWSRWAPVAAAQVLGKDGKPIAGVYRVTVTLYGTLKKGQKEQFVVKFAGDRTKHLAASRSEVVTVRAS